MKGYGKKKGSKTSTSMNMKSTGAAKAMGGGIKGHLFKDRAFGGKR